MSRAPLFIHIPKTAGTSITEANIIIQTSARGLKSDIDKQIQMDPRSPYKLHMWLGKRTEKHIPYSYLDREYINRFDRVFTVVRNPWARLVSFYNYWDLCLEHPSIEDIKNTWYYQDKITWEEYLERMDHFMMTPNFYWQHPYDNWASQSDWLPIKHRVDVLRFENLQEDLNNYLGKKVDLPIVNKSKVVDYRSYYNEEQKQKVAKWFKVDIERWGFDFESGATKNYWSKL